MRLLKPSNIDQGLKWRWLLRECPEGEVADFNRASCSGRASGDPSGKRKGSQYHRSRLDSFFVTPACDLIELGRRNFFEKFKMTAFQGHLMFKMNSIYSGVLLRNTDRVNLTRWRLIRCQNPVNRSQNYSWGGFLTSQNDPVEQLARCTPPSGFSLSKHLHLALLLFRTVVVVQTFDRRQCEKKGG